MGLKDRKNGLGYGLDVWVGVYVNKGRRGGQEGQEELGKLVVLIFLLLILQYYT